MITAIAFVLAAGAGAVLRLWARRLSSRTLPWGTLAVNLVGSFVLGVISAWSPPVATVLGTAGLGALTTFSTFADELVSNWRAAPALTSAYGVASIVGGVGLAWCGLILGA